MIAYPLVAAALVLLHLASLAYAGNLPYWMARDDQRIIRQNGARNSLRGVFHRQRLCIRAGLVLAGAAPWAWAGAHSGSWWAVVGALAYFAVAGAWFLRRFNPELNLSRDPPKPANYVSLSPHAARFDKWFADRARADVRAEVGSAHNAINVAFRAARLLESYTRRLLIITCAIAGPLWLAAVWFTI